MLSWESSPKTWPCLQARDGGLQLSRRQLRNFRSKRMKYERLCQKAWIICCWLGLVDQGHFFYYASAYVPCEWATHPPTGKPTNWQLRWEKDLQSDDIPHLLQFRKEHMLSLDVQARRLNDPVIITISRYIAAKGWKGSLMTCLTEQLTPVHARDLFRTSKEAAVCPTRSAIQALST